LFKDLFGGRPTKYTAATPSFSIVLAMSAFTFQLLSRLSHAPALYRPPVTAQMLVLAGGNPPITSPSWHEFLHWSSQHYQNVFWVPDSPSRQKLNLVSNAGLARHLSPAHVGDAGHDACTVERWVAAEFDNVHYMDRHKVDLGLGVTVVGATLNASSFTHDLMWTWEQYAWCKHREQRVVLLTNRIPLPGFGQSNRADHYLATSCHAYDLIQPPLHTCMSGGKSMAAAIMDYGNARVMTNPFGGDHWFDGRVIEV
jgi:hypothetical protein